MSHAFILGATSTLAKSLCQQLSTTVGSFTLVGRDPAKLERLATDLGARQGIAVERIPLDLLQPFDAAALLAQAEAKSGPITHFFSFPGLEEKSPDDPASIARLTQVNYTAPAQFMAAMATRMLARGTGHIVAVSSVAGDRGRASNYPYGAAKAALSTFTDGLRHRLHDSGVRVMTVKPGFIATPMTAGMQSPLMASPEKVAAIILRAMKKNHGTVYAPWFWWGIMLIIRNIPGAVFNKMKL